MDTTPNASNTMEVVSTSSPVNVSSADTPVNRIVRLLSSDSPPWVEYLDEALFNFHEGIEQEVSIALQACRDHILVKVNEIISREVAKAVVPLQDRLDGLEVFIQNLPNMLAAIRPPELNIQVPQQAAPIVHVEVPARRVIKTIQYDAQSRPIAIGEREVEA